MNSIRLSRILRRLASAAGLRLIVSGAVVCLIALVFAGSIALAQDAHTFRRASRRANPGGAAVTSVLWQQGPPPGPPAGPPPDAGPRRRPFGRPGPPPWLLERLRNLPPDQRERVLENNRRFQELPPERQDQLRRRLRQFQELTPEQRDMIEQRFSVFRNLSPEQQDKARKIYQERWRDILPERRRALMQEFRRLRGLQPEERRQRLESREFLEQFNQNERDVLAQLIAL